MSAPRFCPSCGAATSAAAGTNVAFCSACGGSLTVAGHTQINLGPSADNLLGLARTAALAGNAQEAYDYAVRVLESNPKSVDAWLLKATSAGWLSTLAATRVREMIIGYQGALGMAGADDRDVRSEIVLGINNVGVAVHELSLQHVLEFPMLETWVDHIGRSLEVLDAFDFALELMPDDRQVLDNCLTVATGLIQGIRYTQPNGSPDVLHLTADAQAATQRRIEAWSNMIRELDPNFLTPAPKAQTSCFVVTATMGAEDALPVTYLRDFRDEVLIRSTLGRRAITRYYRTGPVLAHKIAPSRRRRAIAFAIVVVPAMATAFLVRGAVTLRALLRP